MDILSVDREIKKITKNEDAAQNVWVWLLDNNIADITEIKKYASKHKVGTLNKVEIIASNAALDRIPSNSIITINDGGYNEEMTRRYFEKQRIDYRKGYYRYRNHDVICKYYKSNNVRKYGFYNYKQLYHCNTCNRKFKDNNHAFHKSSPISHVNKAIYLWQTGLSLNDITKNLYWLFNTQYSKNTIYRWVKGER